ncbi:hypothetical protein Clacol_002096 [Clathrus columnatus]|uniref:Uncharacterized protein n=1 Tax=Clathrus columnatus TaxID=1419009 RepID=A0AAV5A0W2_9AGAM|nr:hypothetical protein Clacol_002096 [Clathrus columnatus]
MKRNRQALITVGLTFYLEILTTIDDAFETQIRVETASGVEDDFTFKIVEDHKLFEQTISNYVEVTANHLIKLKKRLNNLVTINRLPVELSFSSHWRSVLIQNPTFWTSIQLYDNIYPFVHELLRRSDPLKLDFVIHSNSTQFPSTLEELFAKESNRIGKLWLRVKDTHMAPFVSGKQFPSLRGISSIYGSHDFYSILPILFASDRLETVQCSLSCETPVFAIDQLAPVFCRIRNMNLTFYGRPNIGSLLNLLHNSANLQNLRLTIHHSDEINFTDQIVLPELQFLSTDNLPLTENIRAPKLSSLAVNGPYYSLSVMETLPNFDFSGTRYLYVLDSAYSILGLKEPIHFVSSLPRNTKDFVESTENIFSIEHIIFIKGIFSVDDILSDPCPRNCFRFEFYTLNTFVKTLGLVLCPLLSRMENLAELYLLSDALPAYYQSEGNLNEILLLTPSVEKLIVRYGTTLTDFILPLGNTSLCPRLNNLSYVPPYPNVFVSWEEAEYHAEEIGRTLTECLRSRHEIYGERLKHIAIEQCPPLSDAWLKELQSLGTKVITAKGFESVLRSQVPEASDGDAEMND